jgi:hypothetical protein
MSIRFDCADEDAQRKDSVEELARTKRLRDMQEFSGSALRSLVVCSLYWAECSWAIIGKQYSQSRIC